MNDSRGCVVAVVSQRSYQESFAFGLVLSHGGGLLPYFQTCICLPCVTDGLYERAIVCELCDAVAHAID